MPYDREHQPAPVRPVKKIWRFLNSDGVLIILENEKHYQETKLQSGFQFLGEEVVPDESQSLSMPKIEVQNTPIVSDPLECESCGFMAKSEFGLKIHKKKHE